MQRLARLPIPELLRYGWMVLCVWDLWMYRFVYHQEAFGVREENLSWYLTGIVIFSTLATIMGLAWGLSRFQAFWGFLFWLTYLLVFGYSSSFSFSGHHLLLLVFPFLLLSPTYPVGPINIRESRIVMRIFTLLLGVICLQNALLKFHYSTLDGRFFGFFLSRDHALNRWLAEATASFPWGYLWTAYLVALAVLLFIGTPRCRQWACLGFLLWGVGLLLFFQLGFLGLILILTGLFLFPWQPPEDTASREAPDEPSLWEKYSIRIPTALLVILLYAVHSLSFIPLLDPVRKVAEKVGLDQNWDYLSGTAWYPEVVMEGKLGGTWIPLIGKSGQRSWNLPEMVLLTMPAMTSYPPETLTPELSFRMEQLMRRWQIEWGDEVTEYRLLSHQGDMEVEHGLIRRIPRRLEPNIIRDRD